MRRSALWLILLSMLTIGLAAGPDLWAAPNQSPARQTVPTPTPEPQPTEPPSSKPKPKDQLTPVPTPTVEVTPTIEPSEPLLPRAGGWSIRFPLGVTLMVVVLLAIATATWWRPGGVGRGP